MTTAFIFDIRKYSIHDGPGIRTTVFFKGCPLVCWWCHNPEGQSSSVELMYRENRCIRCYSCVDVCTQNAILVNGEKVETNVEECIVCGTCTEVCYAEAREIIGKEMSVNQVMKEIESDFPFYEESGGGVTFSGGEPLLQNEFLLSILKACKEKGIHTAVDTCGFAQWNVIDQIRDFTDLFLYDIKLINDSRHKHFTGVSNELILKNLRKLSERGNNMIIRIPIIPGINDDKETLNQIIVFISELKNIQSIDLLPYHHIGIDKYRRLHKTYLLPDAQTLSEEKISELKQIFVKSGLIVNGLFK